MGFKVHLVDFDGANDSHFKTCTTHHWLFDTGKGCTQGMKDGGKKFFVGKAEDKWLVLDAKSSHIVLNSSKPNL